MSASSVPALITFISLVAYFTTAADSTYVVVRPFHTAVSFLTAGGLALIATAWIATKTERSSDYDRHSGIWPSILSRRTTLVSRNGEQQPYTRVQRAGVVLTIALVARASLTSFLLHHIECTGYTSALLQPIVVLMAEKMSTLDATAPAKSIHWKRDQKMDLDASRTSRDQVLSLRNSNLLAIALITLSNVALNLAKRPRSTYICATTSPYSWLTPLVQHGATIIDGLAIYALNRMAADPEVPLPAASSLSHLHSIGNSFLDPRGPVSLREAFDSSPTWTAYVWSLVKITPLVTLSLLSFIKGMHDLGPIMVMAIAGFVVASTNAAMILHEFSSYAALPLPVPGTTIAIVAMAASFVTYLGYRRKYDAELTSRPRRAFNRLFLLLQAAAIIFSLFHLSSWWTSSNAPLVKQYEHFILSQREEQEAYEQNAASSTNLTHAVQIYYDRHGKWPPPGFDKWYEYANARNSIVIDEFATIHFDILPFYTLDPSEIRERTHDLIADPNNDVVGVLIRGGRAHAGPHVTTYNRALVDGLVRMINRFAEHLPDMDIAVNTKEAGPGRVVVPWDKTLAATDAMWATQDVEHITNSYQPGRSRQWLPLSNTARHNAIMTELPSEEDVYRYSTVWCPAHSAARSRHYWGVGRSCTTCALKSFGYAPNRWQELNDVCSQPDLQYLHGMYLAPASFKATHELYPVFSHYRANGFTDMLYPSVWDWLGKTQYTPDADHRDPIWKEKKSTLFWRGTTTEGVSFVTRKWQGMLRQRFVHLINNIRNSSPVASVLARGTGVVDDQPTERFVKISAQRLAQQISTDVQFSPDIINCREEDCHVQRWEFAPTQNVTHFQDHWQYKYLLDMDGSSPSASFLPFLRSRSLPLRVGLMQEWWQERVRPWVHFVPLDVRGLDFWTTITWLTGFEDNTAGQAIVVDAHEREAERIATAGRQWADVALRKEDMEIYFFRLLLEWARVTDDWRDHIGFTGQAQD